MTVGKLYTVGTAGELYIAGEVCGSGQAVGVLGKLAAALDPMSHADRRMNGPYKLPPTPPVFRPKI